MLVRFGQIFTCEHCGIEMTDSTLMNQHEFTCSSKLKEEMKWEYTSSASISKEKKAEALYWVFVDNVKWAKRNKEKDYLEKIKNELSENPNKLELYEIYKKISSDLYKVLDNYLEENISKRNKWPLGDDSTSDFIAHICGEGKESYYEYLQNPHKMFKRAIKDGYLSESFDYIWN